MDTFTFVTGVPRNPIHVEIDNREWVNAIAFTLANSPRLN